MDMDTHDCEDFLDHILAEIEPDHIPAEFVQGACITDEDGNTQMISCEELEDIMCDDATLEEQGIFEVGLILDIEKVKETILHYCEIILKDVAH